MHIPESPAHIDDTPPAVELDKVELWRAERLEAAGYTREDAMLLAVHNEVDLHKACELIRCGCPAVIALDLLVD